MPKASSKGQDDGSGLFVTAGQDEKAAKGDEGIAAPVSHVA